MDSQPHATVVLFPGSQSHGFKEATMGITLLDLFPFLVFDQQCTAGGGVVHIQGSAGDGSDLPGGGDDFYGQRRRCLIW
jgi:hypothetical protein